MWLSEFRVVLRDRVLERASVRLDGGRIAEIRDGAAPRADVYGATLTLIPGLVDIHGDMLEREIEPRPGAEFPVEMAIFELDKRLAANGITTAFSAISFWLNERRGRSRDRALALARGIAALRPALVTDLRVHARFEITQVDMIADIENLVATGIAGLVSLMDHTPGQGQYRDVDHFVEYMRRWRGGGWDVAISTVDERVARRRKADIVPAVDRLAAFVRRHGVPLASHDDDTEEKVSWLEALGVSISEFPVTIEAARAAKRRGLWTAMGAPNALRGDSHSGNLSAREAIREGLLDVLATDFHPPTLLTAAFALARDGLRSLPQAIAMVTANPAAAVGLDDRGEIRAGQRADLVVLTEAPLRVIGVVREGRLVHWMGEAWTGNPLAHASRP